MTLPGGGIDRKRIVRNLESHLTDGSLLILLAAVLILIAWSRGG